MRDGRAYITSATASTPGGIGNLGPGLDVLGCALVGARDSVTALWTEGEGVSVLDPGHPDLPRATSRHTSAIAASAVLHRALSNGVRPPKPGIALTVIKQLPLSGGQGGSAASAVAGAASTNALLGSPLGTNELLECCLVAEAKVAGRHLDNIAPSLLGGIVLIRSLQPIDVIRLPVPAGLVIIIVHPAQRLSTSAARRALPRHVSLDIIPQQMANVAGIVAACFTNDVLLLGRSIDDRIAEPARASLIPGFTNAKRAAIEAGALGVSISGGGPSIFAVCHESADCKRISDAMTGAFGALGIGSDARVTKVDPKGTEVTIQ